MRHILEKITENLFEYLYKKYLTYLIYKDFRPNQYLFFENVNKIDEKMSKYLDYSLEIEKEYNHSFFNNDRELMPYMTIQYYAGYFHEKINDYLRETLSEFHKSLVFDEIIKRTKILKKEVGKFQLESNFVVIRRVKNTFLKEVYLKGKKLKKSLIIYEPAFLSTSLDLFYRKDYQSNYSPLKNETIIIIKVPKGVNALYLEPISKRKEFELLLNPGLRMRIEDKKRIFGNHIILVQIVKS
ncbi:hypothetical protein KUL118_67460 [Tenacibaculum sp. KUL118]|nr:hypothetical protein KUL118_67460 [Tenacibaculum sp. KUL118]